MPRNHLEVADIFRVHGPAWRRANAGHVSLGQLKVMSAIESCRTAALGGHVAACEKCDHIHIAYNSCRNRHCPKCQGAAAKDWLAARQAELLPVAYYHVVFTLPAEISAIAYHNKATIYAIGHLKDGHRTGGNYLAHQQGDAINPILAAAGYNFHLILKWIRLLWLYIWATLCAAQSAKTA